MCVGQWLSRLALFTDLLNFVSSSVLLQVAVNQEDSGHKLPLPITVTEETLEEMLGVSCCSEVIVMSVSISDSPQPKKFEHELSQRLDQGGVAVGLAWTAMGGEILFVEATKMLGNGELVLRGQLSETGVLQHLINTPSPPPTGNVMKESALIALSWLRSNASTVSA